MAVFSQLVENWSGATGGEEPVVAIVLIRRIGSGRKAGSHLVVAEVYAADRAKAEVGTRALPLLWTGRGLLTLHAPGADGPDMSAAASEAAFRTVVRSALLADRVIAPVLREAIVALAPDRSDAYIVAASLTIRREASPEASNQPTSHENARRILAEAYERGLSRPDSILMLAGLETPANREALLAREAVVLRNHATEVDYLNVAVREGATAMEKLLQKWALQNLLTRQAGG